MRRGSEREATGGDGRNARAGRGPIDRVSFGPVGPFDENEKRVVRRVASALAGATPDLARALDSVQSAVTRLETLTEAISAYPPELRPGTPQAGDGGLESLLDLLSHADRWSFELCLPTRALLCRDLVVAEVNFYRLLRSIASSARTAGLIPSSLAADVDDCLCRALHSRLALEVLERIASDDRSTDEVRAEAARALWSLWRDVTQRLSDFFPALAATWEARRQVPVVLGTLSGTVEMYQLIGAGCAPAFVEWLLRPDQPEEQAEAFREFLFGTTTEELERIERRMSAAGHGTITRDQLPEDERPHDASTRGDPAMALFDFFLSRHLRAGARRLMGLPGPTRTAEEYVMLHFLEERCARASADRGEGPGTGS